MLVDDELSTGRTALNTITALHRIAPRERYVLAALVDVRPTRLSWRPAVRALGARLDVVALAAGRVELPAGPGGPGPRRCAPNSSAARRPARADAADGRRAGTGWSWPASAGLPGCRSAAGTGSRAADHAGAGRRAARGWPRGLGVRAAERTLVLGTEELMQLPLRLAQVLADAGHDVVFSTTTRSPALVVDEPDYALRSGITFPAHDDPADGPGPRFAYNLGRARDPPWDHVLVVVDPPADTAALHTGLLAALAPRARRTTLVVDAVSAPAPLRGPAFGSYRPDEVGWLLTDLSGVPLEAPTEEREEAIQSGGAHYAESLPQEYQPDAEYLELYRSALAGSAAPARAGRRHRHRAGAGRARDATSCWSRWPGPAPRSASCCAAGRPRGTGWSCRTTRCRSSAAAASTRSRCATSAEHHDPAAGGVRRRLDRQGRHRPRAVRRAGRARRRFRPGPGGARRPGPVRVARSAPATTG